VNLFQVRVIFVVVAGLWSLQSGDALAGRVSLLEETMGLHCAPKAASSALLELNISPKDTQIDWIEKETRLNFRSVRFLQSGLFAENSKTPGDFLWVQLFEDGQIILLRGKLQSLRERQCSDAHGAKRCRVDSGMDFEWSTEKLWTKLGQTETFADVSRYGLLGGRGTYFFGVSKDKPARGIILADYGEEMQILVGELVNLSCGYGDL
jgi:hypothetical protein